MAYLHFKWQTGALEDIVETSALISFAVIPHLCNPTLIPTLLGLLEPIPMWGDPPPSPPSHSQTPAACLRIQLNSDT